MKIKLSVFLLLVAGCYGRGTDESALFALPPDLSPPGRVDFNFLKTRILESKCSRCHLWAHTEEGVRSQIIPGNPESSPLYREVESGSMPQGAPRLSGSELQIVRDYILALSQEDPDPVPSKISFETLKQKVLIPHCISCHRSMDTPDGIILDIEPGRPEQSLMYLSVKSGSMPKSKPPLTVSELEIVRKYIEGLLLPL